MKYVDSLKLAMERLSVEHDYHFVGQGAIHGGHGMAPTLDRVAQDKRIEMPVFEETQTGIALGMALAGTPVVSMYPRFDFFISGLSQLINHADKVFSMSSGRFNPNLIYRVAVGSKWPIDAGPQHTNDYSEPLAKMLTSIEVVRLINDVPPHETILKRADKGGIQLYVEYYELYGS